MKLKFLAVELNFINGVHPFTNQDIRIRKGQTLFVNDRRGNELMKQFPGEFELINDRPVKEPEKKKEEVKEPVVKEKLSSKPKKKKARRRL